jgi:ABC-type transport system involved in multi-copper enzyme maturation permease subunit
MMQRILALALLTFKEGMRDRALYGIFLFSLMVMALGFVVIGFFMRELSKVASDFNLSALTFGGLLLTLFVNNQLLAKDIDRRTIYIVLSKPYGRGEYIFAKYLGLMLLTATAILMLGLCASAGVGLSYLRYPAYFEGFSFKIFLLAILGEFLMLAVLNAVVVFFASFSSSAFLTLLFSTAVYIVGESMESVFRFLKTQTTELPLGAGVEALLNVCRYLIPNLSVFDLKTHAAHGMDVSLSYVLSMGVYGFACIAVLLFLASRIFKGRELG